MSIEGVDLSFSRPGGAAIKAAGKQFVVRYLSYSDAPRGAIGKFLTAAEVSDYRSHGLSLVANFESTANRALSGGAAGNYDATDAGQAMFKLGFPGSCPVYFSVDVNTTAANYPAIDAYLHEAGKVLGDARIGVYGEYDLIDHCSRAGTARWFWQTRAWSNGLIHAKAHIYQYANGMTLAGGSVDYDRARFSSYGQWAAPGLPETDTDPENIDMLHVKPAGPFIGTFKIGSGHSLIDTADFTHRYDWPAGAVLNVVAALDLVDAKGVPIDIDGNQPPQNKRNEVYLVDGKTPTGTAFGADAFALRQDGVFTPTTVTVTASTVTLSDARTFTLRP